MITGDIKEIGLNGLTSTGSDYDCADGDMQVLHNMVSDGSGLKAVNDVVVRFALGAGLKELVYVHRASFATIYVALGSDGYLYYGEEERIQSDDTVTDTDTITEGTSGRIKLPLDVTTSAAGTTITSVGNVLVVNIANTNGEINENAGLHYFRAMRKNGVACYSMVDALQPDLNILFELQYMNTSAETLRNLNDSDNRTNSYLYYTSCLYSKFEIGNYTNGYHDLMPYWEAMCGICDKLINDCKERTWFLQPFFVRWAYRLYDGSFSMQSSPILMIPDTGPQPFVLSKENNSSGNGVTSNQYTWIMGRPTSLRFKVANLKDELESIRGYKDVVQSIVIAVTPQILTYATTGEEDDRNILIQETYSGAEYELIPKAQKEGVIGGYGTFSAESNDGVASKASIEARYNSDAWQRWVIGSHYKKKTTLIEDDITSAGIFYIVKEYELKQLETLGDGWITVDDVDLQTLETLEQLTDGYNERKINYPKHIHVYNSRLNICNITYKERANVGNGIISCYTGVGKPEESVGLDKTKKTAQITGDLEIYIEESGIMNIVKTSYTRTIEDGEEYDPDGWGTLSSMPGYLFYPDTNAKYAHFTGYMVQGDKKESINKWWKLKAHPTLSGAYYFNGFYGYDTNNSLDAAPSEIAEWGENYYTKKNYMYTSEVDNPFVFPSQGVEAIGNGEIVAIKEATKAVSEGTAFGTMPLYAFCTDGIWSLSVGDTGLYSAKQPVSRETLMNDDANCATQIDNSIVFLSDRGLMELSGGSTRLLSGALQGRDNIVDARELPAWSKIHAAFGGGDWLDADDFIGFIKKGARIAFDYERYRLVIYREGESVAYLYDVGTETWATMANRIKSSLEGFPATLLNLEREDGGTEVGVFSIETATPITDGKAFYLTRPLKLGEADTLKTIRRLIERGVRTAGGKQYLALWGSRDMATWKLIGAVVGKRMPRLSGTPYKYFMVGGWTQLTKEGERVSRLTLESKGKYTDKVR